MSSILTVSIHPKPNHQQAVTSLNILSLLLPLTCRLLRKSGYSVSMELWDSSGKHRMKLPHATQAAEGGKTLVQVGGGFYYLWHW